MRIPDDGLLEVNEKFRIVLEEPVNAILGEKDRVTVRIINAESGKCLYFVYFLKRKQRIIINFRVSSIYDKQLIFMHPVYIVLCIDIAV